MNFDVITAYTKSLYISYSVILHISHTKAFIRRQLKTMADLKFMSILLLTISFTYVIFCESELISDDLGYPQSPPPSSVPTYPPLPTSAPPVPSYVPAPFSNPPAPAPSSSPPEPASISPSPSYPSSPTSPLTPFFLATPPPSSNQTIPTPSYSPPAMPYPSPSSLTPSEPPSPIPSPPAPNHRHIKAAYWPSFDGFPASSIDTSYFTHIYYAFLQIDPNTYVLNITPLDQQQIPSFITALRTRNPPVKTLLSIGGAGNNRTALSQMVSTEETRKIFIESTIEVARKYGFDGIDFDWEFPENDRDMSNLGLLYKQWRIALNHEAIIGGKPRLLLTSAVYYASKHNLYGELATYPAQVMAKYLDWVSPMCFDYHGSWENFTGAHAALFDLKSSISTSNGLVSWIQAGLPTKKLVMGLPLYGHTWTLKDPNVNGIGAPTVNVGPGGGILRYYEIVDFNKGNNVTVVMDWPTVSYYAFVGDSWVGYDDSDSIKMKVRFARFWGLRGYFFWALGLDKDWTISREASNAW